MQIDKSMLEKAAALPEDQLKELIYAVVSAAGGSKMQARAAANSSDKLKKKLAGVTNEEISEILSNLDGAQMQKIMAVIKEKGVGGNG